MHKITRCCMLFCALAVLYGTVLADITYHQSSRMIDGEPVVLNYLVHIPGTYEDSEKLPVMLFLHGAGHRSNDPSWLHGLGNDIGPTAVGWWEDNPDFPVIGIAPLCPQKPDDADFMDRTYWWPDRILRATHDVADSLSRAVNGDFNRFYVTGLSMGGYGSWRFAELYPDVPTAIAVVCADIESAVQNICDFVDIPAIAWHGTDDPVIPMTMSKNVLDDFTRCGGTATFNTVTGGDPIIWGAVYGAEDIYSWLLAQKPAETRRLVLPGVAQERANRQNQYGDFLDSPIYDLRGRLCSFSGKKNVPGTVVIQRLSGFSQIRLQP